MLQGSSGLKTRKGQLLGACLEDTVMAKLHGLTMGLDVNQQFTWESNLPASTGHGAGNRADSAAYLIVMAGNADPMLGYLTTSFREHPRLRRSARKQISTPMQTRFEELGVMNHLGGLRTDRPNAGSHYAIYMKSGGDARSLDSLGEEGEKKINRFRERGFDLGYGHGMGFTAPREVEAQMDAIYEHARASLYAEIDDGTIKDASPEHIRVRTNAASRDDYLSHPPSGGMMS